MKRMSYKSYRKLILDTTDPVTGTNMAFRFENMHKDKLGRICAIENMDGLRMFITYRKSRQTTGVIELDNLDEFGHAQAWAASHSWPSVDIVDRCIMINGGYATLTVLVPLQGNRQKLANFLKAMPPIPKDVHYTGRPVEELMRPRSLIDF